MSYLLSLFCSLFGHTRYPGIDPDMSLVYLCPRCCRLVPGRLGVRR